MSASQLKVRVQYAIRYSSVDVTEAEYNLVYALYNLAVPLKVQAIKFIRQQYSIGLKEAKDVCDVIGSTLRVPARKIW